jgi:allantoinase
MTADLVVQGGTVATDYGVFEATVVVEGGRIVGIEDPGGSCRVETERIIDAHGKVVIPGCVDPHTHFWEPGPTYREDFQAGTKSCAAGGVTTTLEHPLSTPPVRDAETFVAKQRVASRKSVIDFGLWGGLLPGNERALPEMHALGAVAYKAFMSDAGVDYGHTDDGELLAGLEVAHELGAIIGVHAESEVLTRHFSRKLQEAGRRDPRAIAEGRPPFAEYEAIQRAITLAEEARARLHIVHMSIAEGADLVSAARARGVDVTVETCPHYLHFDWTALDRFGGYAKCKPPFRSPEDVERLWDAVLAGRIHFAGSDHSPYAPEEKETGDPWTAMWGMAGAQTMIPMLISDGVIDRDWDLSAFVRFTSTNAARTFGLYPRKGTIQLGSDGDLVVLDLDGSWLVRSEDLFSKQPRSLLEGETLKGRITHTVLRGRVVYEDGKITAPPGSGQFIRPVWPSSPGGTQPPVEV